MDKENLFKQLDRRYASKREMLSRIPLGIHPDSVWHELLSRRRAGSTVLPLYARNGQPYWYVITDRMAAASEKIVETLFENDAEFDPYTDASPVSALEEVFYTSYVEGAGITMAGAMEFLTGERPPRDIEEQLITNNRAALGYAGGNLYRRIDADLLGELAEILTEGMDAGGREYRVTDEVDYALEENGDFDAVPAALVPDRMSGLYAFLSDPKAHPLIKAAVAQAYIIAVRPFPEGNDRLGRILSEMILLRAGYGFFRDVSLSALIARKSFGYYEALANVTREENEGDLTYFLEYFLELLSRAVDERRLRALKKNEEARLEETETAKIPLAPTLTAPPPAPGPEQSAESAEPPAVASPESSGAAGSEDNAPPGFFTVSPVEPVRASAGEEQREEDVSRIRVRDALLKMGESRGFLMQKLSAMLLRFMDEGIDTFTSADVRDGCETGRKQADNLILHLRQRDLIENCGQSGQYTTYRFKPVPPLTETDYDPEILDAIRMFLGSDKSRKDVRIGETLMACLPGGLVTSSAQPGYADTAKMQVDMVLPVCMGIVEKVRPDVFRIKRKYEHKPLSLMPRMKTVLTDIYREFGETEFTCEQMMDAFRMANSTASAMLHQFVLLGIVGCESAHTNTYRLLVNPVDQPTLFAGQPDEADDPGTCGSGTDTADPAALLSDLKPHEKKTIAAIYDAFGDQSFSTEMFIATVNYSAAYCYASLKNLTMLRILERTSTEDGSRYQLLINPEEYPECFELTA